MHLGAVRVPLFAAALAVAGGAACSSAEYERGDVERPHRAPSAPPARVATRPEAVAGSRTPPPLPAAPRPSPGRPSPAGESPTVEDRRTFDEANRMRAEHGLAPFRWSDPLFRAARDHSAEQARYGYMGHGSPDPARDDLADRLRFADCGRLRAWAEVVAYGYEGPASVVDGWMNSRGHRKILLDPNLEEAGFARVGDYFTGNFATGR